MNEELELLLHLVTRRGIERAEVYQVQSQSRSVFFEGNRLKQLESFQSLGTALRLWHDNRPGLAVAYGKIDPELTIERAIAISQLNAPQPIELTPPRKEVSQSIGSNISTDELIAIGETAIIKLREEYPELICSAELEWESETTTLVNSQGLYCQFSESGLSSSFGAELIRQEDFLGVYDGEYSKQTINLEPIVERIVRRLDWTKHNVIPPQGTVPVLLTANAAMLLWDTVSSALNGQRVREKSSPWSSLQHELVMNSQICLSQQPDLQPYDCPFDDEGTPTQRLNLITNGLLEQFYGDRTTARESNFPPTGNGFRLSLDSYPTPALVNLIVASGNYSFADLVAQLHNGIIVDQILGGGADIGGDFSVNVDLGYRVEQGKITGRIKDTAIAGNVYQILKQSVVLGNDCLWNDSCYTPSLLVEGISVVG